MKSWELLRELFASKGVKYFAGLFGRSYSLVCKWTEPAGETASGARNPLDVLVLLMRCTDPRRVAQWVCVQAGGHFTPHPPVAPCPPAERPAAMGQVLQELGQMVTLLAEQWPDQRGPELAALREQWAQLSADVERLLGPAPAMTEGGNCPAENRQTKPGNGSWRRDKGGCRHRLPDGRCGFPHAARR